MRQYRSGVAAPFASLVLLTSAGAQAADVNYQNYFFAICPTATGALAARCAQTPGGLGNLSGDSESSLNPSQTLSSNLTAAGIARVRNTQTARHQAGGEVAAAADATQQKVDVGPFSLLLQGRWSNFERDRNLTTDRERGIEGEQWALELGFDRRLSERSVIGAVLHYEKSDADFVAERPGVNFTPAGSAGSIESSGYGLTVFASWSIAGSAYFEASAGYDRNSLDFTRNSVFQESTRVIAQTNVLTAGDADGDAWWVAASLGNDWTRGATTFGLYGGLSYADASVDGYTERDLNGSGLAMSIGETERTSALGYVGARLQYSASGARGVFVPYAKLEYLAELDRDETEATAVLALAASTTQLALRGDEPDSGSLNVGAGMSAILPGGLTWFIAADALVGGDLDRQRYSIGLRKEF